MNTMKMNLEEKTVEISLGISENEVETSEYNNEDTLELTNIVDELENK